MFLPSLSSTVWPLVALFWVTSNTGTGTGNSNSQASSSRHVKTKHYSFLSKISQTATDGLVWIDLENVRGRSGFALSHDTALERTLAWTRFHNLTGHVVVVVDHGSLSQAYWYESEELAVVFSGNHRKADDVLAQNIHFGIGSDNESTMVVTADTELKARCQRGASKNSNSHSQQKRGIYFLDPTTFLEDLEATSELLMSEQQQTEQLSVLEELSLEEQVQLGQLDQEIQLRAMILDTQIQLDRRRPSTKNNKKKSQMTNKRRRKLQAKLDRLQQQLGDGKSQSMLHQVTSTTTDTETDSQPQEQQQQQELILSRWKEIQRTRKEQTGDRVVLAEELRRQLEAMVTSNESNGNDNKIEEEKESPAKAFIEHFNRQNQLKTSANNAVPTEDIGTTDALDSRIPSSPAFQRQPTTKERLQNHGALNNPLLGLKTIQIVAISDTHGFEGQLQAQALANAASLPGQQTSQPQLSDSSSEVLPPGDILFHLGDFALEGSTGAERKALQDLDQWLSRQPHPLKIVVRGNHDPHHCDFSQSGALYINEPTSIDLTPNLVLGVIPHGSFATSKRHKNHKKLSGFPIQGCDILATHEPPYKTLDRTFTGKAAGSNFLTRLVRSMPNKPRLWLCGHIHESRGVAERQWGHTRETATMVINAANANPGRATHLDHDAVVVQVENEDRLIMSTTTAANKPPVTLVSMENRKLKNHRPAFDPSLVHETPDGDDKDDDDTTKLLLAVDVGLKSGVSLFNSDGKLLRYEQFQFDKDKLPEIAKQLVKDWEREANEVDGSAIEAKPTNGGSTSPAKKTSRLTHIAVEGPHKSDMVQAWANARDVNAETVKFLDIPPSAWRGVLLLPKERYNGGQDAKAAARLIARQVVDDYGVMDVHQGKFKTDVAEAVCLGLYSSRKLGWIQRDPAVRRYSNGNIVVPKKTI